VRLAYDLKSHETTIACDETILRSARHRPATLVSYGVAVSFSRRRGSWSKHSSRTNFSPSLMSASYCSVAASSVASSV